MMECCVKKCMESSERPQSLDRQNLHLPFLDGLRGFAILSVFLFHTLYAAYGYDQLPWDGQVRNFDATASFLWLYPFTYGMAGVAIFFAVSGFCIHLSHSRSRDRTWEGFFTRRFFRIYPPYLVALAIFAFIWPGGWLDFENKKKFSQLISHVFSYHNFDHANFFKINGSFWSIAVELQLYLIYPILWHLAQRFGWRKSLAVAATLELATTLVKTLNALYFHETLPRYFTDSPFAYWLSWSLGAYLCECYLKGKESRLFKVRFDALLLLSVLAPIFKVSASFYFLLAAWSTCVLIQRLLTGAWKVEWLTQSTLKPVQWAMSHLSFLGMVSFSFYLLHQPFLNQFKGYAEGVPYLAEGDPIWRWGICMSFFVPLLGLSYLFYRCVELPSIALGKKVTQWRARTHR